MTQNYNVFWKNYELTTIAKLAYDTNKFYEEHLHTYETKLDCNQLFVKLAMINTELSELVEAIRARFAFTIDDLFLKEVLLESEYNEQTVKFKELYKKYIKGSIEEEIADVSIRILDFIEHFYNISSIDNHDSIEDLHCQIVAINHIESIDDVFEAILNLQASAVTIILSLTTNTAYTGIEYEIRELLTMLFTTICIAKYFNIDWLQQVKLKNMYNVTNGLKTNVAFQ